MGVAERAEIVGLHREVVDAWKEIAGLASTLGLADRIVIGVKLTARAEALAAYEGLVRDAGDLAGDARAFAAAMKARNPLTNVFLGIGVAATGLGFFGAWSWRALIAPAESEVAQAAGAGLTQTGAALIGVLVIASGAVVIGMVRAAVIAGHAGLHALGNAELRIDVQKGQPEEHPSVTLLREVREAEERLFGMFRQRVPEPPISAGPLIVVGAAGLLAGVVLATLAGVGSN